MYNCLAEVSVLILSGVLFFNTLSSFSLGEKKHVYFLLCVFSVMFSAFTNIISINYIEHFNPEHILVSTIITTIYFVFLGITPFFFACYCYAFVSSDKKHGKFFAVLYIIPITIYLVVLGLNFKYNLFFRYYPDRGYVRGSLKNITYITTVVYSIFILVVVFCNRKQLSRHIKLVFIIYPFLGLGISMIQFFSTFYVMTGTSSFATLLLVYLSIQSDLLEYDLETGLLTENHLANILQKRPEGYLTVISIENYAQLENGMSVAGFNTLIMKFSDTLRSLFGRSTYHISLNKFGILSYDFSVLKKKLPKLFDMFSQIVTEDNTSHHMDFLAAIVELPLHAKDYGKAKELANNLHSRLRIKKEQRIIYCQQSFVDEMKRRQDIYEILDRELKLESEQFQVYFQPVYSVKENRFVYGEALARLKNTEIGDIMPAEFIPIAESRGLIERLGNVVFEKVCAFIAENKGRVSAISVNFSVYQMTSPNIVDYVLKTIRRFKIDPSSIIMEITESVFIDDLDLIRKTMMRLSGEGVRFSLDDFGTGYSNFANVITLPFNTIKIDRSFVLMVEKRAEVEGFVKSLVHTFKERGLNILVEGVETKTQNEVMKRTEIDFIQGFLYSYPVPAEEYLKCI